MVHVATDDHATNNQTTEYNMNTTKHTVRTKLDSRSAEKVETAVTINWDSISLEDTRKLASKAVIIAAQSEWRSEGVIPLEATLDANAYANPTRKPRGPVDPKAALLKVIQEGEAQGKSREEVIAALVAALGTK